jgi:hypothetical protein
MTAARRRLIVTELREHFSVSQRRASRALDLPRSSLRYAPVARDEQAALARRIEELAGTHPRFGYRRIWALLDREGWSVNRKAVRRLWPMSSIGTENRRKGCYAARSSGLPGSRSGRSLPCRTDFVRTNSYRPSTFT